MEYHRFVRHQNPLLFLAYFSFPPFVWISIAFIVKLSFGTIDRSQTFRFCPIIYPNIFHQQQPVWTICQISIFELFRCFLSFFSLFVALVLLSYLWVFPMKSPSLVYLISAIVFFTTLRMQDQKNNSEDFRPGYDLKWLVDPLKVTEQGLDCKLCNGVVRNHRDLVCCGLLCCFGCLVRNNKCPKCSIVLTPQSLSHSKHLQKLIGKMKVKCFVQSCVGKNCNWGIEQRRELRETDEHYNTCSMEPVRCEICSKLLPKREIDRHNKHAMAEHVEILQKKVKEYKSIERKSQISAIRKSKSWWNGTIWVIPELRLSLMMWKSKPDLNDAWKMIDPPGYQIARKDEVLKLLNNGKKVIRKWFPEKKNFLFADLIDGGLEGCKTVGDVTDSDLFESASGFVCIENTPPLSDSGCKEAAKRFNIDIDRLRKVTEVSVRWKIKDKEVSESLQLRVHRNISFGDIIGWGRTEKKIPNDTPMRLWTKESTDWKIVRNYDVKCFGQENRDFLIEVAYGPAPGPKGSPSEKTPWPNFPWHSKSIKQNFRDFQVHDIVDVCDKVNNWYESKIIAINQQTKEVHIHYVGWGNNSDEWIPFDSVWIAKQSTHTQGPKS